MIVEYGPGHPTVDQCVEALHDDKMTSSVQIVIGREVSGLYVAQLVRTTVAPARVQAMQVGTFVDVPPGQRRATWLLTDVVQTMLHNPEAHMLLHW